jgi:hypothetical protein
MATIDTSYVRRELRAIIATSKVVARLVKKVLEQLEADPSAFDELDVVPDDVARRFRNATFRKAKIEHNPHSFRLVFIHWSFEEEGREDHVDVIYAFPRKDGYEIDWKWIESFAGGGDP